MLRLHSGLKGGHRRKLLVAGALGEVAENLGLGERLLVGGLRGLLGLTGPCVDGRGVSVGHLRHMSVPWYLHKIPLGSLVGFRWLAAGARLNF